MQRRLSQPLNLKMSSSVVVQPRISISGTECSIGPHFGPEGCREMSWDALGEAMISKLMDEVACVRDVDFKYGPDSTIRRPREQSCISWEFVQEKRDVMIFKKRLKDSRLSFMGRGVIEKPLLEVVSFIRNIENNMSWDHFLIESRFVKTIRDTPSSSMRIGYQRYETKKCMQKTKRDFLSVDNCVCRDGIYIYAGMSIDSPEYPCASGVKRIEVGSGSGWVLEKLNESETSTLVTYVGNADLKGLPIFIMNLVLKRHPYAIYYIRQQMVDPSAVGHRPRCSSSTSRFSEEDETEGGIDPRSLDIDLPDDFVPNSFLEEEDEDCGSQTGRSYEQSMPMEFFTQRCGH